MSGGLIFWAFVGAGILAVAALKAAAYVLWITLCAFAWLACATARGIAWWVREGVAMVNRDAVIIEF
jgi:hypothetical protein